MTARNAIPLVVTLSASMLAGLLWRLSRRARALRRRRLRLLEMKLRLANAQGALQQEVSRLRQFRVLRPNALRQNAGLFPSTKLSSLRYIKGRQNDD